VKATAELPLRGEIWDAHFPPPIGLHPVVVITSNSLIPRLAAVTAAVVTGTSGPPTTHVPLDPSSGVTKYPTSWVNAADLQAVPHAKLRRRRGRLAPGELAALEDCVRDTLAL
jgi:mRNA interferase MazF